MGSFQGRGTAWWMVMIVVVSLWASCRPGVGAVNYKVGDSAGWTLGQTYTDWTAGKTFRVGDTLEFVYNKNSHDVVEVSSADYAACSKGNSVPIADGDTKYTLNSTGSHYYICTISGHCSGGMKVEVTVEAASTTPSTNATTPASTPTSPPTPTSTPASNTTSPPSSSPLPISYSFFSFILTLSLSLLLIKS